MIHDLVEMGGDAIDAPAALDLFEACAVVDVADEDATVVDVLFVFAQVGASLAPLASRVTSRLQPPSLAHASSILRPPVVPWGGADTVIRFWGVLSIQIRFRASRARTQLRALSV